MKASHSNRKSGHMLFPPTDHAVRDETQERGTACFQMSDAGMLKAEKMGLKMALSNDLVSVGCEVREGKGALFWGE